MKNFKKVIAGLLAVLMLALSVNVTFAAEEFTDAQEVAMAKVKAAGIMVGDEKGDFMPNKPLTRAEAAKIIVVMKGISESAVKASEGATLFTDVAASHWASGYVNQASNLQIVKGVSATEFAPNREVTIAEFVTMAIRALGAGQLVDSEGTWPTNYVNFANENDILKDVPGIYTAVAKRVEAATIVANTLKAVMWEKSGVKSNGEISWTKNEDGLTITTEVLGLGTIKNAVVEEIDFNKHQVKFADVTGKKDVADDFDLTTIKLGYAYDGYSKDNKVLGLWKASDNKTTTVEFTEIVKVVDGKTIKVMVDGAEKEYDLRAAEDGNYVDYYNNDVEAGLDDVQTKANAFGTLTIKDNEVIAIYVNEYTNAGVVDEITAKKIKFESLSGMDKNLDPASDLTIDEKGIKDNKLTYFVEKDGKAIDVTDIEEDDVVFYYTEKDANKVFHIVVMSDVVEGKVQSTANYIKIDGKQYKLSGELTHMPKAKDEVKLFLNASGKVFAYDEIEGKAEYAVISSIKFKRNDEDKIKAYVTLAYTDGTESESMEVKLNSTKTDAINGGFEKLVTIDVANIPFVELTAKTGASAETEVELTVANGAKYGAVDFEENETVYLFAGKYYKAADKEYAIADYANTLTTTELNALVKAGKSELGNVFAYEMDKEKVVFKSTDKVGNVLDTEFVKRNPSYFNQGSKYLVNKNTKVLIVKEYKDADDKWKVKVSSIDADSLETTTGDDNFDAVMVDKDNDNYVKLAVIYEGDGSRVKKGNQEDTWTAILFGTDDTDNEDCDFEYTVVTENKDITTLYSSNEYDEFDAGICTINGEEIEEIEYDGYGKVLPTTGKKLYVVDIKDGFIYYVDTNASTNKVPVAISDSVVYVAVDDLDYVIGDEDDLEKADFDTTVITDGASEVKAFLTYTDDDNIEEVIAIIYTNDVE